VDIDIRRFEDVQVIRLRGSLTLGAPVNDLRQTVDHAIKAGDSSLVLNLSDVRWVDSSGIGVLVKSLTAAKQVGGSLSSSILPSRHSRRSKCATYCRSLRSTPRNRRRLNASDELLFVRCRN
jgi:anti-sigma B factor antagonist